MLLPVPPGLDVSDEAARRGIGPTPMIVEPDYRGLEELAAMVSDGTLRVQAETTVMAWLDMTSSFVMGP